MRRVSRGSQSALLAGLCAAAVAAGCTVGTPPQTGSDGSAQGVAGEYYYVTVVRPTGGTIVSTDDRVRCGVDGEQCGNDKNQTRYEWSQSVTFEAIPAPGFKFDGWAADCFGKEACVISTARLAADSTVVAVFVPEAIYRGTYFIVAVEQPFGGKILSSDNRIDCGTPGGLASRCGFALWRWEETATLTAIPDIGYRLVSWGGDCAEATGSVCTLDTAQAETDKLVSAVFEVDTSGPMLLSWDASSWDEAVWQ
jgi:hypothetical protein